MNNDVDIKSYLQYGFLGNLAEYLYIGLFEPLDNIFEVRSVKRTQIFIETGRLPYL